MFKKAVTIIQVQVETPKKARETDYREPGRNELERTMCREKTERKKRAETEQGKTALTH